MTDLTPELSPLPGTIDETRLYTIEELAPFLRVSERTLRKYCSENVFPNAIKIGGKNWRIPGCDLLTLCPYLRPGHVLEGLED